MTSIPVTTLRIGLTLSVLLNIAAFSYFGINRLRASSIKKEPWQDVYNRERNALICDLPIDSNDIVLVGDSHIERFPEELFGTKNIKNRGIGFNNTYHVLNRIDPIAKQHPKSILLEIGVNDLSLNISYDSIIKNYNEIIDHIYNYSPRTRIIIQLIMPTCGNEYYLMDKIKELNNLLNKLCIKRNIQALDMYSRLLSNQQLNPALTTDGIHLNYKGYLLWKSEIEKFVLLLE